MMSRIFGGLPVIRMPMRKILPAALNANQTLNRIKAVVITYSIVEGGPLARFIIANGV